MRVLVAGDRGYLGAVLVPFLRDHGHHVVGLDAGWYDGCDFGPAPSGYEQRTGDVRDARPDELAGLDAVVNLAAISNDPVGHLNPDATFSVNADGAVHLGRAAKAAGVRALRVRLVVLALRAGGRRPGRRGLAVQPRHAVRREQGAGRGRAGGAGRRRLQPDLPPQRDRLRLVASAAGRHRGQQPDRDGDHPGRGAAAERRIPVAAARPRRGHRPRRAGRPRGAARGRARHRVQRRPGRGRRADPQHRRTGGRGDRRPGHVRRGRRARHPRLPGRLHPHRQAAAGLRAAVDDRPRHRAAGARHARRRAVRRRLRRPQLRAGGQGARADGRRPARRRPAHAGPGRSGRCGEPPVPAVCGRADRDVRRPRHVAAVRELPGGRPARPRRDLLPAARAHLLAVPAGAAPGLHRRRGHLQPLRLLLVVQRLVGGPRRPLRRRRGRAAGARGPTRSWSRWPATTATCSSTWWPGASGRSASSRRPTWPRRPWPRACPPRCCSSARRPGPRWPPSTARPTWWRPTTCSPTCPTSSTSPRACGRWSPTTGE